MKTVCHDARLRKIIFTVPEQNCIDISFNNKFCTSVVHSLKLLEILEAEPVVVRARNVHYTLVFRVSDDDLVLDRQHFLNSSMEARGEGDWDEEYGLH